MLDGTFYTLLGTHRNGKEIRVLARSQDIEEIRTSALFNQNSYGAITLITSPCGGLEFRKADFNVVEFEPNANS